MGHFRLWATACGVCLLLLLLTVGAPQAGHEHLALMYGVVPADIALAGARAEGVAGPGAAFHNPAALADLAHNSLTPCYIYAQPFLRGGPAGKEYDFTEANKVFSMSLGWPLGRMFEPDVPVGMGMNMLVDDNFSRIVAFDEVNEPRGQFKRYGIRSFALAHSLGGRVFEWLNVGVGYLMSYSAEVNLIQDVQITSSTENEQIRLTGAPTFSPLVSLQFKTRPVVVGLVWRGKVQAVVNPVTGFTTPKAGDTVIDEFPTIMQFKDSFTPNQWVAAVGIAPGAIVSATLQAEAQLWAEFDDEVRRGNNSHREADLSGRDIFVPRVGVRYRPGGEWEVRAGYAYEPSPFDRVGSEDYAILDSPRHRVAAGAGFSVEPKWLDAPLSFDAAVPALLLWPREKRTKDGQMLRSSGYVLGGALSMTWRY
ncbi:MAG: hypothetical protein P9L99_08500 [Candidatus Lernaella stagnicola]|nr:hypothetical protein [Candidatus Lernaella stagnicola]